MDGSGGSVKQYSGSMDCAKKLVAAEGPGSLFKGLPPALFGMFLGKLSVSPPLKASIAARASTAVPTAGAALEPGVERALSPGPEDEPTVGAAAG